MPDTQYPPIPAHVYTLACALVKTKRKEDSPVIIRIEDMDSMPRGGPSGEEATPYTVYPVTFEATYQAHEEWSPATGKHTFQTFAGWTCLNAVASNPGGSANAL